MLATTDRRLSDFFSTSMDVCSLWRDVLSQQRNTLLVLDQMSEDDLKKDESSGSAFIFIISFNTSISFLISDVFIFLYGADLKPFNTFVMQNNDSGVDCVYVRKRDFRFWQEKFK